MNKYLKRPTDRLLSVRALVLPVSAAVALFGCGADAPSGPSTNVSPAPAGKGEAQVAKLTKGMVAAVTHEKPGAAVALRFDVQSRPEIGQPVKVEVAMVPQHDGTLMRITYISGQSLAVRPSPAPTEFRDVRAASAYKHEASVTPQENGVFYLTAIVQLEAGGEPQIRTFYIPIVVGELPERPEDLPATTH